MDKETFKKEVATKTFSDVVEMVKKSKTFSLFEAKVKSGADSKETEKILSTLYLLEITMKPESTEMAVISFVETDLLFEKLNKRLRKEILGKKPKDKVKKEDVRKMIEECFEGIYESGVELRDDILKKLEEM